MRRGINSQKMRTGRGNLLPALQRQSVGPSYTQGFGSFDITTAFDPFYDFAGPTETAGQAGQPNMLVPVLMGLGVAAGVLSMQGK